jgi:putative membrane protein
MSKYLTQILFTTIAALICAYVLTGIEIKDVLTAFFVSLVLSVLNTIVKPLLILLTIPLTIITLGLFLIVINILIIKWVADIVPGFTVSGWWSALWFSILLSFLTSILNNVLGPHIKDDNKSSN